MMTLLEKQRSGVPLMTVLMLHPRDLPHIAGDVEEEDNDEVVDDDGGEDDGGGDGDGDLPIWRRKVSGLIISVMTVISGLMIIVFVEHTTSNIKMCDDHITLKVLSSGMSVDKVLNPGINRIVKKED